MKRTFLYIFFFPDDGVSKALQLINQLKLFLSLLEIFLESKVKD